MRDLLNQGRDLHAYTARYAFKVGLDLDDKTFKERYKDYRQKAKVVNFALIYGGTQYTLVKNFGFSEEEALQAHPGLL
jgi:DNA polymerase I-like protein with 3'-5' exonuclease and polymerase domains